jgi:acetyl esterase/lipase
MPPTQPPRCARRNPVSLGVVALAIVLVALANVGALVARSEPRPVAAAAPLARSAPALAPPTTAGPTTTTTTTTTAPPPPPTTVAPPPTAPPAPTTTVPPVRSVTVDVAEGVAVDVHLPAGHGPYPVVVYVHGGGWISGDKADLPREFALRDVLDRGWALVSVGYRYAGQGGLTATDQVADVTTALGWIRGAGRNLGLGDHTVGIGHSAGGHLLSLVAATAPAEVRPAEVIVVAGIYDFGPDVMDNPMLDYAAHAALGCPPEDCPRRPSLEPANFAEPGDPFVSIVHGAGDPLVDPVTAHRYGQALQAAGVAVAFHSVEGASHLDDVLGAATRAVLHARLG